MDLFPRAQCLEDSTLLEGEYFAVFTSMVNQIMHSFAQQIVDIAQSAKASWVAEGTAALEINSTDAFGG